MVGDTTLREVVGTDLLRTVSGTDLATAHLCFRFCFSLLQLQIVYSLELQEAECLRFVLHLGLLSLTVDHDAGGIWVRRTAESVVLTH